MSVSSSTQTADITLNAFAAGADLWVIKNDPNLNWWVELDFGSRFLLSRNYFHSKKDIPSELIDIIKATSIKETQRIDLKNFVLIGSSDHFLNKWILVWDEIEIADLCKAVDQLAAELKFESVRFFSHASEIKKALKTRPTSGSLSISYIE